MSFSLNIAGQAFLFPGQGAQTLGMAVDLAEKYPSARALFQLAEEIVGVDFLAVCRDGPENELNSTRYSQPAIFLHSMATLEVLASRGVSDERFCTALPVVGTAGLSLGEYSALVFAGSLAFEDALRLVVRRGEFMQKACDSTIGTMASVMNLASERVEEVINEARQGGLRVGVSNYNSPDQTVISGEKEAVHAAIELLKEAGAKRAATLRVAGAYHSELMASATAELAPLVDRATIKEPRVPFFSNVTGARVRDPEEIRRGLIQQVESSVRWVQILRGLLDSGMQGAYELGPGRVLRGLMRSVDKGCKVVSLGTAASIEDLQVEPVQ